MSDEPEYLRRMREAREARAQRARANPVAAVPAAGDLGKEELEAVRWAREVAKAEPRSIRNLKGARYALLVKLAGASGSSTFALEGLAGKDALVERIKSAVSMGDELVGAYEVRSGRPLTISMEGSEPSFKAGPPRAGAQKVDPQRMLRRAAAEAAERAKQRPARDRDSDRGGRRR
jgi:hypothetical protein